MPNTAQINFNVTDASFSVAAILKGVSCLSIITQRGPYANGDLLIPTWEAYLKLYGGYINNSDGPLLAKRAFDRGAQLRINRVGHYSNITSAASLTALKSIAPTVIHFTIPTAITVGDVVNLAIAGSGPIPSTPFNTDSDTTLADVATLLTSQPTILSAVVTTVGGSVTDDRTIIITPTTQSIIPVISGAIDDGAGGIDNALVSVISGFADATSGASLFTFKAKYPGQDYNNVSISTVAASNGDSDYFNLVISHINEPQYNEVYANIKIPGNPTIVESTYLIDVQLNSNWVDVEYADLSSTSGQQVPLLSSLTLLVGTDGDPIIVSDYVGDSGAKNGFHAFDGIDDALQMAVPEIDDNALHIAGSAYVASRKDINYYAHLSNSATTAQALVTKRSTTNIDSRFTAFFAGGVKVLDPITSIEKEISEMGDVIGIMAYNDFVAAEWFSPAGTTRGKILNALGVVNNFGSPAKFNDLNLLANRQINMVIVRNNRIYLVDAYTAQLSNSKLSSLNIQRLLLFMQKSLSPTLAEYIEEPNDIPTFRAMFRAVEPFLDSLVVGRALFSYRWQGDQDISDINQVVINNTADLDNGKYKVRLFMKPTPTLKEIGIEMVVTSTGVSFETIDL